MRSFFRRVSPFLWFTTPIILGVVFALGLDLLAFILDEETFSQAMDKWGQRNPLVRFWWLVLTIGLSLFLYWHFWIQKSRK